MSAKKLIVLTALVVALFAFVFLFERKMPTTAERQQKGDLVWDLPEERIESVRLERAGSVVELARSGPSSWRLARPEPFPADGFAASDLVSQLARRSEEHTSELQSRPHLVCRLLLEKKKKQNKIILHKKRNNTKKT